MSAAARQPAFHRRFATPIVTDTLASAEGIAELRRIVLDRRAADPRGTQVSNMGGWQSDTGMIDWGGEAARALAHKMMVIADRFTHDVRSPDRPRHRWHPEMWANVSGADHGNQFHAHPGAFWSAVAYLDDGGGGEGAGGELLLQDPRMPMIRMTAPDLRIAESAERIEPQELAVPARTGLLILFPAWLTHAVRPYRGPGTRISVACNLVAVPEPAAGVPRAGRATPTPTGDE